jgi:glycosyltransferase involved in cell wall biosynthesis
MKTTIHPRVSIVTPVYNGAEFLAQCIDSVIAQTYPNWDYTILNNCSTDRTLEIAEEYAAREPRIRVVNNVTFLRAIQNHNAALRLISSESKYCKVLFGDDWLYAECLEKMVALAEQNPSVGIVSSYRLRGSTVNSDGPPYGKSVVSGREICRSVLLEGIYPFGTSTSLLIRSDLVRSHDPFFNESNIHADSEACYELLKESDFGFVHQVLTFTRMREGSLSLLSWKRGTLFAGNLNDLVKFGPCYLGPEEFKSVLQERLATYYRFLGRGVFERRGSDFLDFHAQKLAELGLPLSRFRVWIQAARHSLDRALALNWWPYVLSKRLLRKLESRNHAPSADGARNRHLAD